jgi:hypothetical protein
MSWQEIKSLQQHLHHHLKQQHLLHQIETAAPTSSPTSVPSSAKPAACASSSGQQQQQACSNETEKDPIWEIGSGLEKDLHRAYRALVEAVAHLPPAKLDPVPVYHFTAPQPQLSDEALAYLEAREKLHR